MPEVMWSDQNVIYNNMYVTWDAPWFPREFTAVVPEGNLVELSWRPFYDWVVYTVQREYLDGSTWVYDEDFGVVTTDTLADVQTTDNIGGGQYRYRVRAERSLQ